MSDLLALPSDLHVKESITNISIWLQSHSHSRLEGSTEDICAEDLAIAVPGECLFPELTLENEEASREEEKGVLVYTDRIDEKYIWLYRRWLPLEKILNTASPTNGWQRVETLGERLMVLMLTQLDYAAKEAEAEVPYGCCPLSDPAYLLWIGNRPVGMCSLKRKGTSIWGGDDVYACDSLDTLYVRQFARRQGHTLALLRLLASQLPPGEHLGLSHPVSLSMCKVLLKFIQVYPSLRDTLWTLDEDGEVSGTVLLMLGSLMMRGALIREQEKSNQSEVQITYKFDAEAPMITDKVQDTKMVSEDFENKNPGSIPNDSRPEVDEPCDTS